MTFGVFCDGIMRSRNSLSQPRCIMEQKTRFSRRGETDANLYMRTCTFSGLGVTCHNILETTPPVNRLVIPAQFVPFNSWCIIHSVSHSHTHTDRNTHTHIQTHTCSVLIIIRVYPWRGLKFICWGCERVWLILEEVTLYRKHTLPAYSFIYHAAPVTPLSLSAIWRRRRSGPCVASVCKGRKVWGLELDDESELICCCSVWAIRCKMVVFPCPPL